MSGRDIQGVLEPQPGRWKWLASIFVLLKIQAPLGCTDKEEEGMLKQSEASGLVDTINLLLLLCREFLSCYFTNPTTSCIFRTCFWAGDVFTPKLFVKNKHNQEVPVQQFLQDSFLNAWEMVVRATGDLEGVIGFQVSRIGFEE